MMMRFCRGCGAEIPRYARCHNPSCEYCGLEAEEAERLADERIAEMRAWREKNAENQELLKDLKFR